MISKTNSSCCAAYLGKYGFFSFVATGVIYLCDKVRLSKCEVFVMVPESTRRDSCGIRISDLTGVSWRVF